MDDDRDRLAATLHNFVDTGELSTQTARDLMIAMYGLVAGEEAFEEDPQVAKIIKGHF